MMHKKSRAAVLLPCAVLSLALVGCAKKSESAPAIERPAAIMVEMIFEVRVERMLALTPLPSPSASTMTDEFSSLSTISI